MIIGMISTVLLAALVAALAAVGKYEWTGTRPCPNCNNELQDFHATGWLACRKCGYMEN